MICLPKQKTGLQKQLLSETVQFTFKSMKKKTFKWFENSNISQKTVGFLIVFKMIEKQSQGINHLFCTIEK